MSQLDALIHKVIRVGAVEASPNRAAVNFLAGNGIAIAAPVDDSIGLETEITISWSGSFAGNITLGNASILQFESSPPGSPMFALRTDVSENLYVGAAGANGPTNVFYNVDAGGLHEFYVADTSEYAFSSTQADFKSNNILTTGFLAIGTGPTVGGIRLASSTVIVGGSDRRMALIDGSGNLFLGTADGGVGSDATNAILGAASGGSVQLRVAGTIELLLSATAADFQNNNILTTGFISIGTPVPGSGDIRLTASGAIKSRTAGAVAYGLITAGADGMVVGDTTGCAFVTYRCATSGAHAVEIGGTQQIRVITNALDLHNGSNTDFDLQANAVTVLGFDIATSSVRNIAFFAAGSTNFNSMDRGVFFENANAAPTASPSTGFYAYAVGGRLAIRNQNGNADIDVPVSGGLIRLYVNAGLEASLSATQLDLQNNNLLTTGFVQIGTTVAGSGDIRLTSDGAIKSTGSGGTYSMIAVSDVTDGVAIGDGVCSNVTYRTAASGVHKWEINGVAKMRQIGTSLDHISKATTTTTAGQTNIALLNVAVPTDKGGIVYVMVTARDQTNADVAGYFRSVCVKNASGTVSIIGTPLDIGTFEQDATWNIDFVGSGANLVVRAAATDASNSVKWDVHVTTLFGT